MYYFSFTFIFQIVSKTLSHQLQDLNRAVCIECPELRIPWFSQERSLGSGKYWMTLMITTQYTSLACNTINNSAF